MTSSIPISSGDYSQSSPVSVDIINITKLSSTNYLTWSIQVKSLLQGYDLSQYIDASVSPPPQMIQVNNKQEPNPDYTLWHRQDCLIFCAIIGAIETQNQPLLATAKTSLEAWTTLASTYGKKPTRAHIKLVKKELKQCVKGTKTVDEYMELIQTKANALTLLGCSMDIEDITDIVLDGLGDDYRSVIESVQCRDNPISFGELHQTLLNKELDIMNSNRYHHYNNNGEHHTNWYNNTQQWTPKPYLGRCQACGTQGHSAKRCPQFRLVPVEFFPNEQGYHDGNLEHLHWSNFDI